MSAWDTRNMCLPLLSLVEGLCFERDDDVAGGSVGVGKAEDVGVAWTGVGVWTRGDDAVDVVGGKIGVKGDEVVETGVCEKGDIW